MAADKDFIAFLNTQVHTLRTEIQNDPNMEVDLIIEKAVEIKRIVNRLDRIANPVSRKKPVVAPVE